METIKLTPLELVESWNVLNEAIEINADQPGFTGPAKRFMAQIRDNVLFWNDLSREEREAVAGEKVEIPASKMKTPPEIYSNDMINPLSRFIEGDLPKNEPALKKLVESKREDGKES